ncbi:hypothetical protein H2200_012480 [Cladophialophora chaetospira]|uniref:Uncharacterized protein n=1 Tax=Cladophialophora chaetospira TaxID=386627 RepID=A0AA39CCI1_9EURO|nr:hypothetical protein H2200_012480 [Cladophialophora chaetospira]
MLLIKQLSLAFYNAALSQFSEKDFLAAGFSRDYFSSLLDIQFDKRFHVIAIEDGLQDIGATPNKPCTYKFSFHNVKDFVSQASVLDGISTSAFQDGAPLLHIAELIANSQAILTDDAMAQAIQRQAAGVTILGNPRGQVLSPNETTTLLAPFIISCPSSNMPLPLVASPRLTVTQKGPFKQNQLISFSVGNGTLPSSFFVMYISGDNTKSVFPTNVRNNTFKAPTGSNMAGQTYVFVSSINTNAAGAFEQSEAGILFGPTVIEMLPLSRNATVFDSGFPNTP